MTTYILQVLGKKFKKLSWTKFVDMIINNELSSHNELGEYKLTTLPTTNYKLTIKNMKCRTQLLQSYFGIVIIRYGKGR